MLAPLRRTLRDRLDRRSVVGVLLFALVLGWLFGQSYESVLLSTLLSTVLVGGSEVVADAYDLRSEVRQLAFGLFAAVSGVALALLEPGTETGVAMGALFAVGGAWLLLDGTQTLRHEGLRESEPSPADGDEVYRRYLAGRVRDRLRERPHTRRELREAFAETPDAVDEALDRLRERGLVEREGSAFVAREDTEPGAARRALTRLARPVTLELGDDVPAVSGRESGTPRSADPVPPDGGTADGGGEAPDAGEAVDGAESPTRARER